ncbi:MAG TPA: hypothetical protein VMX33_01375 [bacterium]|nr:hypothetical protein [bacterium]
MDSSLRASAFAGLGAFILSCLIALLARVPFGVLLMRAILSGLAFGAFVYGSIIVFQRFMPELLDGTAVKESDASMLGSVVDIVVPGGEYEHAGSERSASIGYDGAILSSEQGPRAGIDSGELEREVADLRTDSLVASDPQTFDQQGVESGNVGSPMAPRPSVGLDELDTLPDLEGFSDSFSSGPVGGSDGSDDGSTAGPMGVSESMPTAGSPDSGQDPVVLAKAVQTLLRRDQKGQS